MRLSKDKRDKISEQILAVLFSQSPKTPFTSEVASEIARDEEFIKSMLVDLKKKKLISEIKKNPKGVDYTRRSRWTLTDAIYLEYKRRQGVSEKDQLLQRNI